MQVSYLGSHPNEEWGGRGWGVDSEIGNKEKPIQLCISKATRTQCHQNFWEAFRVPPRTARVRTGDWAIWPPALVPMRVVLMAWTPPRVQGLLVTHRQGQRRRPLSQKWKASRCVLWWNVVSSDSEFTQKWPVWGTAKIRVLKHLLWEGFML